MEQKSASLGLKLLIAGTFVFMVLINALAVSLPLNGVTPGEVSDAYGNLFAPSGMTFSIWGVIYLLLAAHTLYQMGLFRGEGHLGSEELLTKVGLIFAASSLVNAGWIFPWQTVVLHSPCASWRESTLYI